MTAGSLHNSDHLAKKPGLSTLTWSSVAWISLMREISVQVFVLVIFGCWSYIILLWYIHTYICFQIPSYAKFNLCYIIYLNQNSASSLYEVLYMFNPYLTAFFSLHSSALRALWCGLGCCSQTVANNKSMVIKGLFIMNAV